MISFLWFRREFHFCYGSQILLVSMHLDAGTDANFVRHNKCKTEEENLEGFIEPDKTHFS